MDTIMVDPYLVGTSHSRAYNSVQHLAAIPVTKLSSAGKFVTKTIPCTKYSKELYFNKGVHNNYLVLFLCTSTIVLQRYSPAFSAYNAFLDRILKNIEH